MSFSPAPSSFRPPTAAATGVATSSGLEQQQQPKQFNIGTVSPKRSRIATKKPSVEKRSVNYKKGIDSIENRKLRRTKLGEHRSQDRTRRISQRRRSGENNGLRGNTNTNSISNSSSKSITNNSTNTSKIEPSNPRTEKKVYTGSAKEI
ncbi:hypothetical protein ACHAWU_003568 [Discostella pseudostelligera]|uniref:Uncharacterized protein n=1 Tax=Discostella pseudostelligera TaxID=259834 RepID=A0ABD3N4U0_9STRA